MTKIKKLFKNMDTTYLVKHYLIATFILALLFWSESINNMVIFFIVIIDFIVFPFVNYLWIMIMKFITGNRNIAYNINIVYIIYKIISAFLLFMFGFILFPFSYFLIQHQIKNKKM